MHKTIRLFIMLYFIGLIGSFFSIGQAFFISLRYLSPILIIIFSVLSKRKILLEKSSLNVIFVFVTLFFVYPLVLIILGIYDVGKPNIIVNSLYYLLTLICCFFIAKFYEQFNKKLFFKDFAVIGIVFLSIALIIYRDITIDIGSLVYSLIANSRSDRSYLGFSNPNQVSILVSVVFLTMIVSNLGNKTKALTSFFCVIILMNTGSRTPWISLFIAVVATLLVTFFKRKSIGFKGTLAKILIIDCIVVVLIFLVYNLTNSTLETYYALDKLSTNRLSRQLATINWLESNETLIFGVGMFNPSFFNSQSSFFGLHTDSYYTFILATMGLIGLLANILLVFKMLYKMSERKYSLMLLFFCISYSFFEATLIFPTSLLTILLFVTFFFKKSDSIKNTKN
ncbi:O-antigen ligase family protein [Enterococcus sp.]|uniref:O-antigen ligase family protein n=1 Tax=Enterococcus sp. TaxID=35783 RepID=UPI003C74C821